MAGLQTKTNTVYDESTILNLQHLIDARAAFHLAVLAK